MSLVDQLREELKAEELPVDEPDLLNDDVILWNYLKARNSSVSQAAAMLRKSIEWRRVVRPREIRCSGCCLKPGTHSIRQVGFDNAGRPIIYSSFTQATTQRNSTADAMAHLIYVLENAIRTMPPGISQWILVIDCQGKRNYQHILCSCEVSQLVPKQIITVILGSKI
ncbi:unnamed protein product [Mesocestoides corti]|uniref:CRAL-TRIO domain-containing protein n=2 Tax=Mesocestoides corti TaxID=53468 RepID=A0A0R3U497_MESCO|nr:unnamed protein product [Mesocestoides corti]